LIEIERLSDHFIHSVVSPYEPLNVFRIGAGDDEWQPSYRICGPNVLKKSKIVVVRRGNVVNDYARSMLPHEGLEIDPAVANIKSEAAKDQKSRSLKHVPEERDSIGRRVDDGGGIQWRSRLHMLVSFAAVYSESIR
jgi:hypothetical protein